MLVRLGFSNYFFLQAYVGPIFLPYRRWSSIRLVMNVKSTFVYDPAVL